MKKAHWHFHFLAIVFVAVFLAPVSSFTSQKKLPWQCYIHGSVAGDSSEFYRYAQDTWTGIGVIVCDTSKGDRKSFFSTRLTLRSLVTGDGPDASDRMTLKSEKIQTDDINYFSDEFRVKNAADGTKRNARDRDLDSWQMAVGNSKLDFLMSVEESTGPSESRASMESGIMTFDKLLEIK
jgi:hypothetical protein